jgi:hypothetical protein
LQKGCRCRHIALISGCWSEAELGRAKELRVKVFAKPFRAREVDAWLAGVEHATA